MLLGNLNAELGRNAKALHPSRKGTSLYAVPLYYVSGTIGRFSSLRRMVDDTALELRGLRIGSEGWICC